MATNRIAHRVDTAANWASANPTLVLGEMGFESDTGAAKRGDGSTSWNSLEYATVHPTATQTLTNKTLDAPVITTGAYLGGTAAANLLDDYEEGTWTPQYTTTGTDFTTATMDGATGGRYTKTGDTVHLTAYIRSDVIDATGATGVVAISGLPFPNASAQGAPNRASGNCISSDFASNAPHIIYGLQAVSNLQLFYYSAFGGTSNFSTLTPSDMAPGADSNVIYFSYTYKTDA